MSEITLAKLGTNGQRHGTLSRNSKDYIDKSYQYETVGTMAISLGVNIFLVETYCRNMGYNTPIRSIKKPKIACPDKIFNVDDFMKNGIF
jgi:hypothetical protein